MTLKAPILALLLALAACAPPPPPQTEPPPPPPASVPAAQPAAGEIQAFTSATGTETRSLARSALALGSGYDEDFVLTFGEAQNGRVPVRSGEETLWAAPAALSPTKDVAAFWIEALTYAQAWDGQLYDAPGGKPAPSSFFADAARPTQPSTATLPAGYTALEAPVEVHAVQVRDDGLWMDVGFLDRNPCEAQAGEVKEVARGWIRQNAAPAGVVANYPKGC